MSTMKVKCTQCKKSFDCEIAQYNRRAKQKRSRGIFCGQKCWLVFARSQPKKVVSLTCAGCGKTFNRSKCDNDYFVKLGRKIAFCTDTCRKKYIGIPALNPAWKGGRHYTTAGYINRTVDKDCTGAHKAKTHNHWKILEHRLVMQEFLKRPLLRSETVHHKNGIRDDNRIENLELRSGQHGSGATAYTEEVNRLLVNIAKIKKEFLTTNIGFAMNRLKESYERV